MNAFTKKILSYSSAILLIFLIGSCAEKSNHRISVTNPTDLLINDAFVSLEIDRGLKTFSLFDEELEIAYQVLSSNEKKVISFVLNLNPLETRTFYLKEEITGKAREFKSRTYSELAMKPVDVYIDGKFRGDKFVNVTRLKVPAIHTDHDALFKYEGPGWESELVGYRFYLDWRNANDIFGKKISKLVLADVGVNDTIAKDDSYHQMQEWGMDIFKVGSSLGIGSIGMMYDNKVYMVSNTDSIYCEIPENGPIRSAVKTTYYGWQVGEKKYDLVSNLSITAGSRLTKCEIQISNNPDNIVTGLAKYEGTDFIRNNENAEWAYIALYGNQTLVGPEDKLGIAIFYRRNILLKITEDELSYIVELKPENGKAEYYFCAAWEQEPDGIKNRNEFIKYLDDTMEYLNNPPIVKID